MISWSYQAQIKRGWAEDQRESLAQEIAAFETGRPYPILREFDPQTSRYSFRLRLDAPAPVENWALRMGDVLHNLRTSLDHLIYCLAWDYLGHECSDTAFPVIVQGAGKRTPDEIWTTLSNRRLKGIPPDARPVVQSFQPYRRRYGANEPLATLHDMDIGDKHKTIEMVAATTGGGWSGPLSNDNSGPVWHAPTPLEDGAEFATWQVTGPDVDVRVEPQYIVWVPNRPVVPWSVVPLLRSLSDSVDEVFAALLPFFKS